MHRFLNPRLTVNERISETANRNRETPDDNLVLSTFSFRPSIRPPSLCVVTAFLESLLVHNLVEFHGETN
jgi:hypothetical protein